MANKEYGLIFPSKQKLVSKPVAPKVVFESDESEDDEVPGLQGLKARGPSKGPMETTKIRKETQVELQKALAEDSSIFQYDEVYDNMKEKVAPTKELKPRFMGSLLKSAEDRKREKERRDEKKIQKEREAEGDQFQDRDSFVTPAYKEKLKELQQAEEREAKEQKAEEMMDVKRQKDMSGFYRHFLNQTVGEEKMQESSSAAGRFEKSTQAASFKKNPSTRKNYRSHPDESSDEEHDVSLPDNPRLEPQGMDATETIAESVPSVAEPKSEESLELKEEKMQEIASVRIVKDIKSLILERFKKRTVGEVLEAALERYKLRKKGI